MVNVEKNYTGLIEGANDFLIEIVDALEEIAGKPVTFYAGEADKIRLLVVKTLSLRHRLTVAQTLGILLANPQRKMFRVHNPLGCPVAFLVGPKAITRFEEEITKLYPNGENITTWKAQERLVTIAGDFREDGLSGRTRDGLTNNYARRLAATRRKLQAQKNLLKKPFRDNPFI